MDLKEVLEHLESCKQLEEAFKSSKGVETFSIAAMAVKKQIPIPANGNNCCTLCNTYLKDDNGVEGDYCPNCG